MTYILIKKPVVAGTPCDVAVVDGTSFFSRTLGTQNNDSIAIWAVGNTVQSSAAQLAAIQIYLQAIQDAVDTSAVETAINENLV